MKIDTNTPFTDTLTKTPLPDTPSRIIPDTPRRDESETPSLEGQMTFCPWVSHIRVVLDDGAKMPTRAHVWDAGYDIYAPENMKKTVIWKGDSAIIDTGVHMEIPHGYVGFLKSKSGLNVNHGIVGEGVIDSGYTGSIRVKLYNHGIERVKIEPGDKIIQLVILPIIMPELILADNLDVTERGNGGFGSTGRK